MRAADRKPFVGKTRRVFRHADIGFALVNHHRCKLLGGNAVYRPVDAVALEGFQHRPPLIGAAQQRGAEGACVQGGEEVAVHGGVPDKPLLHIQLELDLPAGKASRPVNGELRASAEDPLPALELLPGDLPDVGVVLQRDGRCRCCRS